MRLIKAAQKLLSDQRGSYFVEVGLALIVISLAIVTAARNLATNGVTPRYDDITEEIKGINVPDL